MRIRTPFHGALAGVALLAIVTTTAGATSIPQRTYDASVSPDGALGDGASRAPVLSTSGRVVAFETTATNLAGLDLNGPVADVVAVDLATNERRLVSAPLGGGADGPSSAPTMSADGQRIAFVSAATNLVAGDTNGVDDIYLRTGRDPVVRVSVPAAGGVANGPSWEPDISADGTKVVFTSAASNLVPGDTNGQSDVFLRDLSTGQTTRVSVGPGGAQANGRSLSPAISADGRYVAFTSGASNLVRKDNNGILDVFVRDLRRGTTERVSVSSAGRQQNRSVTPPFVQMPDISDDGRYVVFDSDATNLYEKDTNRHTDVFLRDRKKDTTALVSASSVNVQGNNDSFAPRLSPRGRFLTFQSFATNLAAGDGPREDIFVRDLRHGTTSTVTVTASGQPRGVEQVPQLLQRPSISADGRFAAFSSTVTNLVPGDVNGQQDVFVRLLDAPVGRVLQKPEVDEAGTIRLGADDPLATTFVCQVDDRPAVLCPPRFEVKKYLGRELTVRAGGPGMLFDDDVLKIPLSSDRTKPRVTISRLPRGGLRVVRGRATDRSGIAYVEIAVAFGNTRGCKYLVSRTRFSSRFSFANCPKARFFPAKGTRSWRLVLPQRIKGFVVVYAHAVDRVGNSGKVVIRRGVVS